MTKAPVESAQIAIISTGHVSAETAHILNTQNERTWPVCGGNYDEYGWFMRVDSDDPDLPSDLREVFVRMESLGFKYVLFDCDAEEVSDLPMYEW
jgi:hypothetical protein